MSEANWLHDLAAKRDEIRAIANKKLRALHDLEVAATKLKLEIADDEKEYIKLDQAIRAVNADA